MKGNADGQDLIWPWQDRNNQFSWLKASVFTLMFAPGIGSLSSRHEGIWTWAARRHDLLVRCMGDRAPSPRLGTNAGTDDNAMGTTIIVRRMIGVAALAYTIAHIIIYFALRFWNFASIVHEMVTRLCLIVASIATIGLIALGATSDDVAGAANGAKSWQQLHTICAATALALVPYLLSPDAYPEQDLMSGMFFWLMGWRVVNRRGHGSDVSALA
jgi:methionine sulfoxide reductase heme-binding subunit